MKHRSLRETLSKLPVNIQKKIQKLGFDTVDGAARAFVHSVGLRFKAADWMNDFSPDCDVLEGLVDSFSFSENDHTTTHFTPFVEKILVPQGARICVIGDVHGDVAYLVDVLEQLQEQGFLDGDYRLTDPSVYIALVGDYTNRNPHSVEVMLVLFYLYRNNLGRVFLLRGNHEYVISVRAIYDLYQQFVVEGRQDSIASGAVIKHALLAEMAEKFSYYQFPDLLYWFDFLPLAVYVGCYDDVVKNFTYIKLCHGGIEPGYNPKDFLESQTRFQLLRSLNRGSVFDQITQQNDLQGAEQEFSAMLTRLDELGLHAYTKSFLSGHPDIDLSVPHNPRKLRLGMQWNSFLTEGNDEIFIASSMRHRNLLFGKALTNYFLKRASTTGHQLVGIIRGHQHLDDIDPAIGLNSPMLSTLRSSHGIVRQWNGMVYTMGDGGSATGWQAFIIVTTGKRTQDWTATHFYRNDVGCDFEQIVYPYLNF